MKTTLRALVVLALVLLVGPACRSPLEGGAGAQFVRASRSAHDVFAGRFESYLMADVGLEPLLRAQYLKSLDDWEKAIEAAEEAMRPTMMLPAPDGVKK